jgi:hypothetical protein
MPSSASSVRSGICARSTALSVRCGVSASTSWTVASSSSNRGLRPDNSIHRTSFTPAEMLTTFGAAGLQVEYDETGLDGRGLYLARIAA